MAVEENLTIPTRQTRVFLQLFLALDSSCLVCPCFLLGLCLVVPSLDLLLLHHLRVNKLHHLNHFTSILLCFSTPFFFPLM